MKWVRVIFAMSVFIMGSCVKDRTCECKNSNSKYDAGEIEATKGQAKKYCKGLSGGDTECYLK